MARKDAAGGGNQLSRQQILTATSQCLREQGYDGTTVRRIASHLGCAVGSIYRYFRDKQQLLAAVAEQILEPVAAMAERGEPIEQSIRRYHHVAGENHPTYRLMFWLASQEAVARDEPGEAWRLPGVVECVIQAWAAALGDRQRARRLWAVLHGMVMIHQPLELTMQVLHPLLSGAVAKPAAERRPVEAASPSNDASSPSVDERAVEDVPDRPTPASEVAASASTKEAERPAGPVEVEPPADQAESDDVCLL